MKPSILIFIDYYIPGYKAGGPIQTITNMIDAIGDRYTFYILTKDRDVDDIAPYTGIRHYEWMKIGKAFVRYLSPSEQTLFSFKTIFRENNFQLIYFQSFFSPYFTILPLTGIFLSNKRTKPVLIAPRGEFASGALLHKKYKKVLYLFLFKTIFIHLLHYSFQCSSIDERSDLNRVLGKRIPSFIALDFNSQKHINKSLLTVSQSRSNSLKIILLSRIDTQKNIDYAIHILYKLKIPIIFDIYGNFFDKKYSKMLLDMAEHSTKNVRVSLKGPVIHQNVLSTMQKYDLFFLPTKNENFGHVIHEALLAGLPVLISDQTPWHELETRNAGWEISLNTPDLFVEALIKFASLTEKQKLLMRFAALQYGIDVSNNQKTLHDNIHMFESVLNT